VLGNSDPEENEKYVKWPDNCYLLNNIPKKIGNYHCTGQKIIISLEFKKYRENSLISEARE
jgi:hypothetical protein